MHRLTLVVLAALTGLTACTTSSKSDSESKEDSTPGADAAQNEAQDAKASNTLANPHAKEGAEALKPPSGKQLPPPEDVAAPPADAKKTESGIAYKVIKEGSSDESPGPNDTVKVQYTGWTTDGKTFDTTEGRGSRTFPLGRVIPGWTEGIQLMKVGERTRFWIPEELAYKGRRGAPQGMLVFEVELEDILEAPETPADVAAPPADAKKTESGLAYKVLEKGEGGDKPREWDKVTVHYSGWTTDGKMFDSSVSRGRAASFGVNRVIPGWTEGLQLMSPGDKMRFWIPEELAYKGQPGKPAGMLVFDVQLESIEKQPDPPAVPEHVAAPPADAKKTESGLAYEVLEKGSGSKHPEKSDRVKVHYTGWTTDGKMFDSSITRGQPATFPLERVIAGWTEGLQLMVEGEKTRFWIPEELAYKGKPGKPQGMLVFEVELLEIVK